MKLKIPPLLIVAFCAGLLWGTDKLVPQISTSFTGQSILTLSSAVLGVCIMLIAIGLFSRNKTTVNPMDPSQASALVTGGIYKITRNPMYLGMLLILIGVSLHLGNPLNILVLIFFVWVMNTLQIRPEETALKEIFGVEYDGYCQKVRRWI